MFISSKLSHLLHVIFRDEYYESSCEDDHHFNIPVQYYCIKKDERHSSEPKKVAK